MLFRKKDRDQGVPFHLWHSLDISNLTQLRNQPVHQFAADFLVRHFPSAKDYGCLGLVPFLQESHDVILLKLEIVLFRFRPELDLLHDDLPLMLFGLMRSLVLLVLKLAVVHDPAYGRIGSRCNLDKIQFLGPGKCKSLLRSHNPQLAGILVHDADLFCPDHLIDTNPYWLGCCDWQPPYICEEKAGNRPLWPYRPAFNKSLDLFQEAFKGLCSLIP